MFNYEHYPHRRYNPLTGEWVQVSPHRTKRPWQGKIEKVSKDHRLKYDPSCYLCPGNVRANGQKNPDYTDTWVFANDFAGLRSDLPPFESSHTLLRSQTVPGTCRVMCYSPRHDLTLPEMPLPMIAKTVDSWISQTAEMGEQFQWIQIFENKGKLMGSSNSHPHGQIFALDVIPNEPLKEDQKMRKYWQENNHSLLVDYVKLEAKLEERVVVKNSYWLALVPFWAKWPYETLLLPRRHVRQLTELNDAEKVALSDVLKRLLIRYDNLFQTSFPYSMGWHGAPFNDTDQHHWQLHAHFYPPLLRSATIKKFMVGYEMLGEVMRDLTAEKAALQLRELSDIHYKDLPD